MDLTVAEIAQRLQGEVMGDPGIVVKGFAPAHHAREGDLTFAENEAYFKVAENSAAAAILVHRTCVSSKKTLIRVANARLAFAKVLPLFFPVPPPKPGIHPSAIVAPSAEIDVTAHIGPFCVIGEQVHVAAKAALLGFNHVGNHCQIGEETLLFPQVTLYPQTRLGQRVRIHAGTVIGSDGFGYVYDQGMHHKIPQVGCVIIEDEVEIGANVTIDRGALGPTVIAKGTKIDNLVQIGHNVQMGKHCILVAQVAVAGSTTLGDYVTLGGQAGVVEHMKIGDHAMVAGQSGVINDIPAGGKWMGSPAQPDRQAKRQLIALHQLPDLLRRVSDLEQRMAQGPGKESTPPVG